MRIELTRDQDGSPSGIRLRLGGEPRTGPPVGTGRLRRLIDNRASRAVTRLVRAPVQLAWQAVPSVGLIRDESGRAEAVRLRFGVAERVPTEPGPSRVRSVIAQVRVWFDAVPAVVISAVPDVVFRRSQDGRVESVVLRPRGAPVVAQLPDENLPARARKWIIEPEQGDFVSRMKEVWRFRKILWFFTLRNVTKRYEGTESGMFWLFARPLLPLFISAVVFGRLLNVPSDGVPYFLFLLIGTTVWMLFQRALLNATRSLEQNKGLIKKVYFPRVIVPITSVMPALVDYLIYSGLILSTAVYYLVTGHGWYLRLGPSLVLAGLAIFLSVVFAIGVGFWTCVWQTKHREFRMTLRYVMQFWHYLTPVLYPLSQVPEKYHWVVFLNPMAPLVETFKWGLIGVGELNWAALGSAVTLVAATFVSGVWYFNRSEAASVDSL